MSEPSRAQLPYVGPRPFEIEDESRFFGRDQELNDLFDLLIARRLVLLHSPSGAGKSSLIRAGLIPRLAAEMQVNPPIRIGAPVVPDLSGNRFITATLLALGAPLGSTAQPPSLADYLDSRPRPEASTPRAGSRRAEAFIFDQFEEVLTATGTDLATREEFFRQLGEALVNERRWALFALREDHLGAIRPLLRFLPTRLNATYRLDLLGAAQARQSLVTPAANIGVTFAPEAADRLIDDLRRIVVSGPDGARVDTLGQTVEPVQLQVAALQLWEQRFTTEPVVPGSTMTLTDVERLGDVNRALGNYYANAVAKIATDVGVSERQIRAWIEEHLITADGRRDQVLRGENQSAGLSNTLIQRLVNVYLVRAEERRGAVWYELTHDRMIAPIRESNREWEEQSLTAFQKQADFWAAAGKSAGLLRRGADLDADEAWVRDQQPYLTPLEQEYLSTSQAQRDVELRQARARRRNFIIAVAIAVLFALLSAYAFAQRQIAFEAARNAQIQQFAAQALVDGELQPQRSLLVALEALREPTRDLTARASAQRSLQAILGVAGGRPLRGHQGSVVAIASSPDGQWIATGSTDTTIRLWSADLQTAPRILPGHGGPVVALAFSADSRRLYSASNDGNVRIWPVEGANEPLAVLRGHQGGIVAMAVDPASGLLLTASTDGDVRLWDSAEPSREGLVLAGHEGEPIAVAFSPDGAWLASVGSDGLTLLRRSAAPVELAAIWQVGGDGTATSLSFSPDSRYLAVGGVGETDPASGAAWVWDLFEGEQQPIVYGGHNQLVQAVAFSPDGARLVTFSLDGTARLWTVGSPGEPRGEFIGHDGRVTAGVFSPDGRLLATASDDATARLWEVDVPTRQPVVLRGHADAVTRVGFSTDGRRLVTASADGAARVWQTGLAAVTPELRTGHINPPTAVDVSPDGRWIASAGLGEHTLLWEVEAIGGPPQILDDPRWILSLAFSHNSSLLAVGDGDSALIRRWDVSGLTPMAIPPLTGPASANRLAFSPTADLLVAGGVDGSLAIFRSATGNVQPEVWPGHPGGVLALTISPDGSMLATAGQDGRALLWDLNAPLGAVPRELSVQSPMLLRALGFSHDGSRVAVGSDDGTVRVFATRDANVAPIVLGVADPVGAPAKSVNALAFHPSDANRIATASNDRTARIWHIDNPDAETVLEHKGEVLDVTFSSAGDLLATASVDRLARVYSLTELAYSLTEMRGHTDKVTRVAFLADGRLLTTSPDRQLRLWDVRLDQLKKLACVATGRNLSPDEWENLYQGDRVYTKTCLEIADHPAEFERQLKEQPLSQALAHYEQEQQIDPTLEPLASWLVRTASILFRERRTDEALDALSRARAIEPRLLSADIKLLNTICVNAAGQSFATALEVCNIGLERSPLFGDLLYNRGNLLFATSDRTGALRDYQAFVNWADTNRVTDANGFVDAARKRVTLLQAELGAPQMAPMP